MDETEALKLIEQMLEDAQKVHMELLAISIFESSMRACGRGVSGVEGWADLREDTRNYWRDKARALVPA